MTPEGIATLTAAIGGFLFAAAGWLKSHTNNREIKETAKQVTEVHVLVNKRLDTALSRIEQLTEKMGVAGVAVPPKPANGPTMANGGNNK